LRGHPNILKRLLIHASAFNLGILMRQVFGVGAPRRLQGQPLDARTLEIALAVLYERLWVPANALLESSGLLSCVSRRHSALAIA
jgi:transposase